MSWQGTPKTPPPGYELAHLLPGDSLAGLEREEAKRRGVSATTANLNSIGLEVAAANGVPNPRSKTCSWARDLAAWILATGGSRNPVDDVVMNACEPGLGFPDFGNDAVIYLPVGLRRRHEQQPAPTPSATRTRAPFIVLAVVVVVAGGALLRRRRRRGTA
jgi:hypothetical protein